MRIISSGTAALVAAGLCLGFSPVLVRVSAAEPITVAALRAGLAAGMLLPLALTELRRRGRPPGRQIRFAAMGGAALGLDFACWNVSVLEAGAGIATVLINVQVVLMPLLVFLVDGIRPPRDTWLVAPTMLLGVGMSGGLLSAGSGAEPRLRGVLLGIAAGAGYTLYLYLVRRGTAGQNHWPLSVLTVACASAAVAASVVGAVLGVLEAPSGISSWAAIVMLALVSQVLAFALINRGVTRLAPTLAGVLLLLPSVFALVLAAALLGEVPSISQTIGCVVILAGAAWASWRASRDRASLTSSPAASPSAAGSRGSG